ncbi:MAG: hypothetical protein R3Y27_03835 [Clostridia bacterium]
MDEIKKDAEIESVQKEETTTIEDKPKKKSKAKKIIIAVICIIIVAALAGTGVYFLTYKSDEAIAVDELILAIGEVDYFSGSTIETAQEAVDELDEKTLNQLDELGTLEQAQLDYIDVQIAYVEEKIDDIGEVGLSSTTKINTARSKYDALDADLQESVSNFTVLEEAEETYSELEVQQVIDAIDDIGTVSLDSSSKISSAKSLYSDLTSAQKKLVSNYDELTDAQDVYDELVDAKEIAELEALSESTLKITRFDYSSFNTNGAVSVYINFTNKSDKTIKYITFYGSFYNSVGDVIEVDYGYDEVIGMQATGPYATGEGLSGTNWSWGKYYSWSIDSLVLTKVKIEYTDGSIIYFYEDEVQYLM